MNKQFLSILFLSLIIIFSCQQQPAVQNVSENLHAVLWMQKSAEYKANCWQSYKLAELQMQSALKDKQWTAALEQTGNYLNLLPAVILDVDETVLDNSPYEAELIQTNDHYSSSTWNTWCNKAIAEAVPGALEFCQSAEKQGVTIFYVTNRRENLKEATRENLRKVGFPLKENIETILPRVESSDKGTRREIVSENYRILLLIGDNLGDFASGFTNGSMQVRDSLLNEYRDYFGKKWISLANPVYGDWEGALFEYNFGLSNEEKLNIKLNSLVRK
ncbi:MAG: 5'-nucleotidase, lipoprotein e(P4) family [Calditrichaceae bacterium]